jgi:hypothetical protein
MKQLPQDISVNCLYMRVLAHYCILRIMYVSLKSLTEFLAT